MVFYLPLYLVILYCTYVYIIVWKTLKCISNNSSFSCINLLKYFPLIIWSIYLVGTIYRVLGYVGYTEK